MRTEESSVLQVLRISLHVMFAFLLVTGCVLALRDGSAPAALICLVLLLGAVYLCGTVLENRFAHGAFGGSPGANLAASKPRLAYLWLVLIVGLWAVLFIQHLSFTWLMFPIVFLLLHLLPPVLGLVAVLALTLFSIGWPIVAPQHDFSPGTVIGPVMGTLLAVVISFAYRSLYADSLMHQRTAEKLRATRAELALREHESGRIEERERLAREIHDTLAQGLSSIVLISRATAQSLNAGENNKAAEQVQVINRVASENLAEARRFIRDLSSPQLTNSLAPALKRLCETTEEQEAARGHRLECIFRPDGDADSSQLAPEIQETLMRIAQGALANVTAHARAQRAVVTLGVWENSVTLDIYDDGRGFSPSLISTEKPGGESGFGFTSLRRRAEQMGGELSIDSAPGEGTVVSVSLPRPALVKEES